MIITVDGKPKEVPNLGEHENRFHAQRFLKKAFKYMELNDKHSLDPEALFLVSMANSLIYVGDEMKRNNDILNLEDK